MIWLLFRRSVAGRRPQHLLCNGYDWASAAGHHGLQFSAAPGIPGIACNYPNRNVDKLTAPEWGQLLANLGSHAQEIMIDLLLNCALFEPTESGESTGALVQVSGLPMTALAKPTLATTAQNNQQSTEPKADLLVRSPAAIQFVRARMFYGPYKLSRNGAVRFGLPKIHCFSRHWNAEDRRHTVSVMRYVFPRQFKLHNVFTSTVDAKQTTHKFQDYTLRAGDLRKASGRTPEDVPDERAVCNWDDRSVPKRLRARILPFVVDVQKRAYRCAYASLMDHYCSKVPSISPDEPPTTPQNASIPPSRVAAFCWAVVKSIVPRGSWGAESNQDIIKKAINRFIELGKGETMSLHDVLQHLKVCPPFWHLYVVANPSQILPMPWLAPDDLGQQHMSKFDVRKRRELLAEFVYFIFDSLLMPLIRHNFYVTESNLDRNRLLYFRQDVWRALTAPAMSDIKDRMYEAIEVKKTHQRQKNSLLGYSRMRLLPKVTGFRPISNLRRKPLIYKRGKRILGQSINSALRPLYKALLYEKVSSSSTGLQFSC